MHARFFLLLSAALFVSVAGCTTPPKIADTSWKGHFLYNTPRPYPALQVEVDYIVGAKPRTVDLQELHSFLETYCAKPAGISITVDDEIPVPTDSRDVDAIALKYVDGPTDREAAFLYILYYDTRVLPGRPRPENPQFSGIPYPCFIKIDAAYGFRFRPYDRVFRKMVLTHEAGHALGLVTHCTTTECLMNEHLLFGLRRFVTFRNPWRNTQLCADCIKLLRQYQHPSSPVRESFRGRYFVREENGYQIFSLPAFAYVNFGPIDQVPADLLDAKRNEAIAKKKLGKTEWSATIKLEHIATLVQFARDADDSLKFIAEHLFGAILSGLADDLAADEEIDGASLFDEAFFDTAAQFPGLRPTVDSVRTKLRGRQAAPAPGDL